MGKGFPGRMKEQEISNKNDKFVHPQRFGVGAGGGEDWLASNKTNNKTNNNMPCSQIKPC
jgi:hypothetical protein